MSIASFLSVISNPLSAPPIAISTSTGTPAFSQHYANYLEQITSSVPNGLLDGDASEFSSWEEFADRPLTGKQKPRRNDKFLLREKRQTTNGRPVNIFGLGFGVNQGPGQDQVAPAATAQPPISNQDVTFDENTFQNLLEQNMGYVS